MSLTTPIDPQDPQHLASAAGEFAVMAHEALSPTLPALEGLDRFEACANLARAFAAASAVLFDDDERRARHTVHLDTSPLLREAQGVVQEARRDGESRAREWEAEDAAQHPAQRVSYPLITELRDECRRQDAKWGGFDVQGRDPVVSLRLAAAVLEDEVAEVLDAWRLERHNAHRPGTREELLQVAAVALRAVRDCFPDHRPADAFEADALDGVMAEAEVGQEVAESVEREPTVPYLTPAIRALWYPLRHRLAAAWGERENALTVFIGGPGRLILADQGLEADLVEGWADVRHMIAERFGCDPGEVRVRVMP